MTNPDRDRIRLAYGLLSIVPLEPSTRGSRLASQARRLLRQLLSAADEAAGIEAARRSQLRRCESDLVDHDGSCLACGAIQGEACQAPLAR